MDAMNIKHVNNICRAKIYAFVLAPETYKRWTKKTGRQKQYLPGEGQEESLMNKLIRIEWMNEWVMDIKDPHRKLMAWLRYAWAFKGINDFVDFQVIEKLRERAGRKGPDEDDLIGLANRVEEFTLRFLDPLKYEDLRNRRMFVVNPEVNAILETAINLEQKKVT